MTTSTARAQSPCQTTSGRLQLPQFTPIHSNSLQSTPIEGWPLYRETWSAIRLVGRREVQR